MPSEFEVERRWFSVFRTEMMRCPHIRQEMEGAVVEVFQEYNTAIRENRFVVGGVIEYIVGAAMRACGVPVRHRGAVAHDADLMFEDMERGYSIKSLLKSTSTRLVNVLGERPSLDRWRMGTVFLLSGGVGIAYADPALPWWERNRERCVQVRSDALELRKQSIEEFVAEHPEWGLPCHFPASTTGRRTRPARTASGDLAAQVLMHRPILFEQLPKLKPWDEFPGSPHARYARR